MKVICGLPGLGRLYIGLVARLVDRTELFDHTYYLETHGDVSQAEMEPLRHYVAYGDSEGRLPMAFFDPAYYRSHVQSWTKGVNAVLHYAHVGRFRRISPSPWFDVAYYLSHNQDIARAGVDPLLHYLKWGGLEGRSPCRQFDGAHYLRAVPEVAEARLNPLVHYLRFGRLENRRTLPDYPHGEGEEASELPPPSLLRGDSWSALAGRAGSGSPVVDVVVPVYKGRIETLRCLYSVLTARAETPFELVVIDDASPDPVLADDLRRLAGGGLFTLLSNHASLGYVHSVNRGMALHGDRDVILLNSDTEVYDGWLDRLRRAAHRTPLTGTVTPLSNNATIASYPRFLHDNPYPLELGYADLDALAVKVNAGLEAEAPTGIGFCMYVRRDCLEGTGPYDEAAFGAGYGEENDFCQRAIRLGWRNVIAADVFVRHWGAVSFQGEKAKRVEAALKMVGKRHPRYLKDVAAFIALDPLRQARQRLDWTRLQRMKRERNVLIVTHNRGGGTERHIAEDIGRLIRAGSGVFLLRPRPGRPTHGMLGHPAIGAVPNLRALPLGDARAVRVALTELGITEIHAHSLVDFVPEATEHLVSWAKAASARLEFKMHDYSSICPRINLVSRKSRYCGEPAAADCNRCLAKYGSSFGTTDIVGWRAMHHRALQAADRLVVPDQDVADRLGRYFGALRFDVVPHEPGKSPSAPRRAALPDSGGKLRVIVIGAISRIKGYEIVLGCARDAKRRNLPLKFMLLGYSMNDRKLEAAGVTVTGRYLEEDSLERLDKLAPHVAWLPSLWPETYSYTLSIALDAGLPVFAFDIGAIARRLKAAGQDGGLLPLDWASHPARVNDALVQWRRDALSRPAARADASLSRAEA
jgi:GT2 family glycosyltransferase/glycosyltransferase involved in cell wall biosynthesis